MVYDFYVAYLSLYILHHSHMYHDCITQSKAITVPCISLASQLDFLFFVTIRVSPPPHKENWLAHETKLRWPQVTWATASLILRPQLYLVV